MMMLCRNVAYIVTVIKYSCTALRYKRLFSDMVECLTVTEGGGGQGSRPGPSIFLWVHFFWDRYRNIGSTPPIYCTMTDEACMAE